MTGLALRPVRRAMSIEPETTGPALRQDGGRWPPEGGRGNKQDRKNRQETLRC